jgi:hypothetical protein
VEGSPLREWRVSSSRTLLPATLRRKSGVHITAPNAFLCACCAQFALLQTWGALPVADAPTLSLGQNDSDAKDAVKPTCNPYNLSSRAYAKCLHPKTFEDTPTIVPGGWGGGAQGDIY